MADQNPAIKTPADTKYSVVIISDSRGVGLQNKLELLNDRHYDIRALVFKGRGMAQATREATNKLIWYAPDQVIILAGICDITRKNRETKLVSMQDKRPEDALYRIKDYMSEIKHHLAVRLTEKQFLLTFCPVTGMEIATYNKQAMKHPDQDTLDATIECVNQAITTINMASKVATPWTASDVHHNLKGGRKKTRYYKLSEDGLHLNDTLRGKWAATIYSVINKNRDAILRPPVP